ncbi:MAG: YcbK family protein [Desulfopila sp.]
MTADPKKYLLNRRRLLLGSAQLALGLCLVSPAQVLAKYTSTVPVLRDDKKHSPRQNRPITLVNTHTQEEFQLRYSGKSCPPAIRRSLYSFLRDYRTGDVHPIDFRLMDILYTIQRETGSKGIYEVISGYRSPRSNALLRNRSRGVAKNSLHLKGQAIDVRLTDLPTRELRNVAISLKAGGVGYYAQSDFVHIDTGKVRSW